MNKNPQIVETCYDMLDVAFFGKITDFTDGKYNGKDSTTYIKAQEQKADWILNKVKCKKNSSLLDIGCGYGKILETAEKRGANAKGITLSPYQEVRCIKKGLKVSVMNYLDIPKKWDNSFDGVIANGSMEHFAQVQDAINGKQNKIYIDFFKICHRILKPKTRLATTVIHFSKKINPHEIARGSGAFPQGSDKSHFAKILQENLGGWYPYKNQLEKCAKGLFILESRNDGTHDYYLTSEFWLKAIKLALRTKPRVYVSIIGKFFKNPRAAWGMLDTWLFSQSWMWQFRPRKDGSTPTILYRDVWKRVD